jgi:hypothetical protein
LIAATATFALNAGLWFRRGRLAMVFSLLAASCRCCTENPAIPAVPISGTSSQAPTRLSVHNARSVTTCLREIYLEEARKEAI